MRDSVNKLFQQRFQGHETPVDPGVWQGIQQQMAAAAPASDGVRELFKERFQGHEMPVDPSAWANISSQLGHTAAAGTAATGTMWGWVAAGIAAMAVTAAAVLWEPAAPAKTAVTTVPVNAPTVQVSKPVMRAQETSKSDEAPSVTPQPAVRKREALTARVPDQSAPTIVQAAAATAPATAPPSSGGGPEEASEGREVVSGIITDLTEQVIQQPLTAEPEPGLSPKQVASSGTNNNTTVVTEVATEAQPTETAVPAPKLFMPNTFTPNGDQINDTYIVGMDEFQSVMIRVYSLKSNTLVFSTNSGEAWTGANCEDGMYMVAAEARTLDGRTVSEGKVVWLNRNPVNY